MKIPVQKMIIPGLWALCGLTALLLLPAVHLPRMEEMEWKETSRAVPSPGIHVLDELPPSMREVAAKHLFVMQRKATGQNAFPDLVVKGVFIGNERSAVLSLKSRPQTDLRIWEGGVSSALSQIKDPRDPRQPIAAFLREWDVQEIGFGGVTVKHFITGEVEMYAVDYTPLRKVPDDAVRGYGQGIIPQEAGERPVAARATGSSRQPSAQAATPQTGTITDRISAMVQQMTPEQRRQFLQRLQQAQPSGGQQGQRGGSQPQQPATRQASPTQSGSRGSQAPQQAPDRRR